MRIIVNITILFVIAFSSFLVIYVKHQNRIMNIQIESVEKQLSIKINQYKELLNVKTTLLEKELMKEGFKKSLGMDIPSKNRIIYLDLAE
ncbi:MAG: cell division protein FtsL [Pseudomonadota bacterium]|nr:cell division protein FtsL [Pseudomonadota bacterium]MED5430247.1 cell division protein FtsL [Pseudomonadota bacterium]|tara:strand:- start:245 stop:514 length:270 start_codon:yes stop_codon:yes gene_type:complete